MAMLLQMHYCVKALAPEVLNLAEVLLLASQATESASIVFWQEGMVPFDVNVPVSGDIVIGIWFGAYNLGQRLHSRPAAAYAFHTAWFEDRQIERITTHQMDVADPALFPPGEPRSLVPSYLGVVLHGAVRANCPAQPVSLGELFFLAFILLTFFL